MTEENKMVNEVETNTSDIETVNSDLGAVRDESMDLASLVKHARSTSKTKIETVNEEKQLSPLEQLKAQSQNQTSGMVVTNEELEAGKEKPLKNFVYNDERMKSIDERMKELDDSLEKRKAVVVIKKPTNEKEFADLMDEIDSVEFENGKAVIKYYDQYDNLVEPVYIRLRTNDDPEFNMEHDTRLLEEAMGTNTESEESTPNTEESEDEKELKNIVQILIDKTGLGVDFIFNDEEKEKIVNADEIILKEVEFKDVATFKSIKSEKSFQETVNAYNMSNSKTTICFPASGFRAQMKGLTYGELGDITLSMDNVTFDQYYKRLSIIYNKMDNISTGPFKSFEEFLKNFAYVDIEMAIYGLYIATQPEIQEIQLRCGNSKCNKTFDWKYSTRSLLRLERCSKTFLDKMKEISTAPASKYDEIRKNSSVCVSKYVELPRSKFVVEMGVISAYDFLYNFIPLLNNDTFHDAFGEDANNVYATNSMLLMAVRSINVPNQDGTYIRYEGYKDILDAIYNIDPVEIQILSSLTDKIISMYQAVFSFGNVTCPHCKNVTEELDVQPDELVFQKYQRLLNTEIDVKNIQLS